jgi:hypothetical protein
MAFNPTKTRTWKDGTTPQTGTLALGSLFNAEFDQLYENDNYLKTNLDALTTLVTDPSLKKKEVDNANYTILDDDGYDVIIFKNLTADRNCNCPTLSDNPGRKIRIINESGDYDVNVVPEDRGGGDVDKINNYAENFIITEKFGFLDIVGSTGQWDGNTDGWSSIVYDEITTTTANMNLNGQWDDVPNLSLVLPTKGTWLISYSNGSRTQVDESSAGTLFVYSGISTISGNFDPDIYWKLFGAVLSGATISTWHANLEIDDIEYEHTTGSDTIYAKSRASGSSNPVTNHKVFCGTSAPAYIRARRIK